MANKVTINVNGNGNAHIVNGIQLDDGRLYTVGTGVDGRDSLWESVDSFSPCGFDSVETVEVGEACDPPETEALREADLDNVVYGGNSLLLENEKLHRYYADDGNAEVEVWAESEQAAADEYAAAYDRPDPEMGTAWVDVRVADADSVDMVRSCTEAPQPEWTWYEITLDPEEPQCTEEHDWQTPHHIVGGLAENPGCFGHGAGITQTCVCVHCGCRRTTDTWATRPDNGTQGHTSVRYEPAAYELHSYSIVDANGETLDSFVDVRTKGSGLRERMEAMIRELGGVECVEGA